MHANRKKTKNTPEERLAALRERLSADPDGKRLLALARKKRVPISFSAVPRKNGAAGVFDIEDLTVDLNPAEQDRGLAPVLVHELRHLWQTCVAEVREKNISAADMLVRRRLVEGDAMAFEKRFLMSSQLRAIEKMTKIAAQRPTSPDAQEALKISRRIRARFGMKAHFMKAQKHDMGSYDQLTLRSLRLQLELAQICVEKKRLLDAYPLQSEKLAEERRECDQELKNMFNRASAPRPLDDSLVNITREGLSPQSPNYLGFTTAKDLAAFIRAQIPEKTLKKAQALELKIKKTAGQALGLQ